MVPLAKPTGLGELSFGLPARAHTHIAALMCSGASSEQVPDASLLSAEFGFRSTFSGRTDKLMASSKRSSSLNQLETRPVAMIWLKRMANELEPERQQ